MHETKRILLTILIVVFLIAACGAQPTALQPDSPATQIIEPAFTQEAGDLPRTEAEVPRISLEEARVAFESGAALIVDVRSPAAFETNHIVGAISVPLGEIERNPMGLDLAKDQWIITYCT